MTLAEPDDLKDWSLHCFCLGARSTPHRIVATDGNGRLLLEARSGTTRKDLSDFTALETRLALLQAYHLIRMDSEAVKTAFPILGIEESRYLDICAARLAHRHIDNVEALAQIIVADLADAGMAGWREAIVFGHVLDGLTWTMLAAVDALPDTGLSLDRPYWNGAFWARYPRPAETGGTNELHAGDATLVMVWVDANARALAAIGEAAATRTALARLATGARYLELQGRRVPIVDNAAEASHYRDLAQLAVDCILQGSHELAGSLDFVDPKIRTVIFGHDLIWALAGLLCQRGVLRRLRDIEPIEAVFARVNGPGSGPS